MPNKGPNPRRRNGARREKLRRRFKAMGLPCALCGGPINYDLPWYDDGAYELDEIIPICKGGNPLDPDNLQPVHRRCNRIKGARVLLPGSLISNMKGTDERNSNISENEFYNLELNDNEISKNLFINVEVKTSREW